MVKLYSLAIEVQVSLPQTLPFVDLLRKWLVNRIDLTNPIGSCSFNGNGGGSCSGVKSESRYYTLTMRFWCCYPLYLHCKQQVAVRFIAKIKV